MAPGFSQSAIGILRGKPGLELLAIPPDPTEGMRDYGIASLDFKRIAGGLLVESLDELGLDRGRLQVVTVRRPTLEELTDLLFAWRAVRHVRSNAIVLARNGATVGIGAAQASRPGVGRDRLAAGRRPGEVLGHGVGRVLPVPGRHPGGRAGLASPRSSSRAARSATRWRSRSRIGTTWRWSSPADGTSDIDRAADPTRPPRWALRA